VYRETRSGAGSRGLQYSGNGSLQPHSESIIKVKENVSRNIQSCGSATHGFKWLLGRMWLELRHCTEIDKARSEVD